MMKENKSEDIGYLLKEARIAKIEYKNVFEEPPYGYYYQDDENPDVIYKSDYTGRPIGEPYHLKSEMKKILYIEKEVEQIVTERYYAKKERGTGHTVSDLSEVKYLDKDVNKLSVGDNILVYVIQREPIPFQVFGCSINRTITIRLEGNSRVFDTAERSSKSENQTNAARGRIQRILMH